MPTLTQTPIKAGIYGKLAGDTTLTNLLAAAPAGYSKAIYFELAPQGALFPHVIFSKTSGIPYYSFKTGGSLYDEDVWMVKAVDKSTASDVCESIAARVDALLQDASLSLSGGLNLRYLRRAGDVSYSETDNGVRYVHRGANYRIVYD